MMDRITSLFYKILANGLAFTINVIGGAFIAAVFWSFWGWFVVPIGAPKIGFFHAWGLLVMCGLFIPRLQLVGSIEEQDAHSFRVYVGVALAWPIGFVLHMAS